MKTVAYWRGQPIEDLSRDELIVIISQLSNRIRENSEEYVRTLHVLTDKE
jgi:hypothetical protein